MADLIDKRPFDGYKIAITDPDYFVGRSDLLTKFRRSPFEVHVLLGGGRLGKTSMLRAIEWNLLDEETSAYSRAFPVYINLQRVQPKDSDNFRYILMYSLRAAIARWQSVLWEGLRKTYQRFLRDVVEAEANFGFVKFKVINPARSRQLDQEEFEQELKSAISDLDEREFDGICFLLDEAEFIVTSSWGNDACSYIRALKDSDATIEPFLGLLLSGYRGVKEYQQQVGSPLYNIASVMWLGPLTEAETEQLIRIRMRTENLFLPKEEVDLVWKLAGGHPHLSQQTINTILDARKAGKVLSCENLTVRLLEAHDGDFSKWWNANDKIVNGFGPGERRTYQQLISSREGTAGTLAGETGLSRLKALDSLRILAGTGIIRQTGEDKYVIGAQLFQRWVSEQVET